MAISVIMEYSLINQKAGQSQIAYVENGTTARNSYVVGTYFYRNGLLYKTTAVIPSGSSFIVGTNCKQAQVGAELSQLNSRMFQVTYDSNGTYTYELPIGRWFMIYANRPNSSHCGLWLSNVTGQNGYLVPVFATSNLDNVISISQTGRTLTITVSATYCALNIINFGGT